MTTSTTCERDRLSVTPSAASMLVSRQHQLKRDCTCVLPPGERLLNVSLFQPTVRRFGINLQLLRCVTDISIVNRFLTKVLTFIDLLHSFPNLPWTRIRGIVDRKRMLITILNCVNSVAMTGFANQLAYFERN